MGTRVIKTSDIVGNRYGGLTAISESGYKVFPSGKRERTFKCICDCGEIVEVQLNNLRSGNSQSCGCANEASFKGSSTTHGQSGASLYNIYRAMLSRCNNPNNSSYKDYRERGIKVSGEWSGDFMAFSQWAFREGYVEGLTTERLDNDGGYTPENCKWIPKSLQPLNRRKLSTNKSGSTGVYYCKTKKAWKALWRTGGKPRSKTFSESKHGASARTKAEAKRTEMEAVLGITNND